MSKPIRSSGRVNNLGPQQNKNRQQSGKIVTDSQNNKLFISREEYVQVTEEEIEQFLDTSINESIIRSRKEFNILGKNYECFGDIDSHSKILFFERSKDFLEQQIIKIENLIKNYKDQNKEIPIDVLDRYDFIMENKDTVCPYCIQMKYGLIDEKTNYDEEMVKNIILERKSQEYDLMLTLDDFTIFDKDKGNRFLQVLEKQKQELAEGKRKKPGEWNVEKVVYKSVQPDKI